MDRESLYKALISRDPRHDGRFYVGVRTTGIYCRPICPAKPKIANVEFYKSKAEAETAGFRPCLRCRPDLSPLSPQWKGTGAVMSRALALIENGDLQKKDLSQIADQLGMTDRHLRRLFEEHVGASPIAVAISHRLHLARQLLSQTSLSILEVALASGFNSLRRFNDAFIKTYKNSPKTYRKENLSQGENSVGTKSLSQQHNLNLILPYSLPMDWDALLDFFRRHRISGVEFFENDSYARHFKTSRGHNFIRVENDKKNSYLRIHLKLSDLADLPSTVEKIRFQFDLSHNPHHIDFPKTLTKKYPALVSETRGARVPGGFDPFEVAITIILGQLVSLEQARENVKKLVIRFGQISSDYFNSDLTHFFPTPEILKDADFEGHGITQVRAGAIRELSRQVSSGEIRLDRTADLEKTRSQLIAIKGIGPWTVEMIALRCLADTNAFPEKDLIILRAIEKFKIDSSDLTPWRAYLALAIWKTQAHLLTKKKKKAK